MSLKLHEISEAGHRILNPLSEQKLMLVGKVCRLGPGMRQLDLCCGKGEMLCQWSQCWNIHGIGVDISKVFLAAARKRAVELAVADRITFAEADAATYVAETNGFDVVSCIGATWIGGGLVGTLRLMLPALKPGGLLLIGEPFWNEPPPDAAYDSGGISRDDFTSLIGTLERFRSVGLQLVEMVLADHDTWDRYMAAQWWTLDEYLCANPSDPDASALNDMRTTSQRNYLQYGRRYLGWGIFVLKIVSLALPGRSHAIEQPRDRSQGHDRRSHLRHPGRDDGTAPASKAPGDHRCQRRRCEEWPDPSKQHSND
jgi:SAM-dependent methyltransferase